MLRIDATTRALLDAATESALIIEPDGSIVAANNIAAWRLGGLDAASLLGMNIFDFIPVDLVASRKTNIDTALRQATPVQFEDERQDRTFGHSLTPILDEAGAVAGLAVFISDLTNFRRADEELRREKQRQNFLMESLPGFVFLLGPDMRMRYANHAFRKLFGSPRKKTCYEAMKDAATPCLACPALEAMRLERMQEWEWTDKSGSTYQMFCHPMTEDNMTLGLVLGIDITGRKSAERALERSQHLQMAILDNIPDVAWLTDKENRCIAVNEAFALTFADASHIPGGHGMPNDWRSDLEREVGLDSLEFKRTGERIVVEGAVPDAQGHVRWFEAIRTPLLNEAGEVVITAGIARDITARKQAVERLLYSHAELELRVKERTTELEQANALLQRNAEKLERAKRKALAATRAKSSFLANMSHEIRTPLNAILGMTEMALRSGATGQLKRYLETVKAGSASLLIVLNDILDFSKIEARKLKLDEVDFDLRQEVEAAVALFSFQARQKGLSLECRVPPGIPRAVLGDPARLRQILGNLVNNAVKFTTQGGVLVTVEDLGPTRRDKVDEARRLLFGVKDTGCGIPDEKQRQVFESFRQADASVTRRHGGTGLGLTICKELVHLMGGAITVESQPGQGSVFYFTALFKAGDLNKIESSQLQTAGLKPDRPLRILVAEDNELNKELLVSFLDSEGHLATLVSNGREALEALCRERYDILLMDGQMPEMDGLTAARHIRAGYAEGVGRILDPETPIVAMTAHAMKGDRERFLAAGMTEYLTKPLNLDALLGMIARCCPAGAAATPDIAPNREQGAGPGDAVADSPDQSQEVSPEVCANAFAGDAPDLDRAGALERLMGREALLDRLCVIFVETGANDLVGLREAIATNDLEAVRFHAHTLKGNAASVGAMRVSKLALQIECSAKDGAPEGLPAQYAALQTAFATATRLLVTAPDAKTP